MASDGQILQQWDDYIAEYETNLAQQEAEINAKLNSNDYTTAQKMQMAHDLEMQREYLNQLKANKDYLDSEHAQGHALPSTVNFHVKGSGIVYRSGWDNDKLHSGRQISGGSLSGSDTSYTYYSIFKSDELNFCVCVPRSVTDNEKGSFRYVVQDEYKCTGATIKKRTQYSYYHQKDKTGRLRGDNSIYVGDTARCWGTKINTTQPQQYSDIPRIDSNFSIGNFFYVCDNDQATFDRLMPSTTYYHPVGVGLEYDEGDTDVPTDAPWDYFNDMNEDINPDNSVFPEGYHPPDPHDPPVEPEMDESDEGTPPEPYGWNGMVTSPSLFITQYILNSSLLELLGENLWQSWLTTNTDVWENFLFNFASQTGTFNITAALDYIISLRVFPFDLRYLYAEPPEGFYGESDGVYMGTGKTNFTYQYTAFPIKTINSVCAMIPMGEISVVSEKPYDDFRDIYNCSILCYLPFCGTAELNPADVYGRSLKCTYFVDFQSGGCTALVECEGDTGWFPVATKSGVIGFTIPLTATNAGQLAAQFASDAVRAVGTMSGMYFGIGSSVGNGVLGALGAGEDLGAMASSVFNGTLGVGQATVNAGLSLANQAVDMLSRSGIDMPMLSGGTGCENLMMYREPFVEIRRGKYAKPENFPHSLGYANATSKKLEEFHGMNCFVGVDVSGLECHGDELAEIVAILETGVYLP